MTQIEQQMRKGVQSPAHHVVKSKGVTISTPAMLGTNRCKAATNDFTLPPIAVRSATDDLLRSIPPTGSISKRLSAHRESICLERRAAVHLSPKRT